MARQATRHPGNCQEWTPLARDLFLWRDSCNVYLLRRGDRAVVVDPGTGAWAQHVDALGVRHLDGIVVTHGDRDQACGLTRAGAPVLLRAAHLILPAGDADLWSGDGPARFWQTLQANGCPAAYRAPRHARAPDGRIGADSERLVGDVRFCAVATPGHTRGALSYVVEWHGRQLVFCGDAARADATLTAPFQLEWDHWTPEGALAAWYGLERLAGNRIDWLLPAHGEPLRGGRAALRRLQRRLLDFVRAKTAVAPGARSRWADGETMDCGALRLSEHLFAVGGNGFVLADGHAALLVDPTQGDLPALTAFLDETGLRPEVATASHYHVDHTDALNEARRRWGAQVWLHPRVAEPIVDRDRWDVPWLPAESVVVDRALPRAGGFRWRAYRFDIRPFPGQTWWHCAFDTHVDGRHVLFSGDNFQPATRWNGTGGFCAYNGSRFDGWAASAQTVLDLAPELICNGHRCIYHFDADHYRRIAPWAESAAAATRALCPSAADPSAAGDEGWLADYDPRARRFEPFVRQARRGRAVEVSLVCTNHRTTPQRLTVLPVAEADVTWSGASRTLTVPPGATRRARFEVTIDRPPGRHVLAADIEDDEGLHAEEAVLLVDVS